MREIVRMPAGDLAAFRADPIWPVRAAAVGTTLRELEGEASPAASLDALAGVAQPVLQLLGGDERGAVSRGHRGARRAAAGRAGRRDRRRAARGAPHPRRRVRGRGRGLPRRPGHGRLSRWTCFVLDRHRLPRRRAVRRGRRRPDRPRLPPERRRRHPRRDRRWLARQPDGVQLGCQGFIAAVVVAVFGAIVVRVILEAISPKN